MNPTKIVCVLTILAGVFVVSGMVRAAEDASNSETGASARKAVDADTIKDKVSVTLGQHLFVNFTPDGDKLLQPKSVEKTGANKAAVEIQLQVTDSTPFPVKGVATRPYLVVTNGFDRGLDFHALARLKGSKEYFRISTGVEPVGPGDNTTKCWESGSLVEEVVLYQFSLIPKPSK